MLEWVGGMEKSWDGACSASVGIAQPTRGLEAARAWQGVPHGCQKPVACDPCSPE